jgi:hypothetical protein
MRVHDLRHRRNRRHTPPVPICDCSRRRWAIRRLPTLRTSMPISTTTSSTSLHQRWMLSTTHPPSPRSAAPHTASITKPRGDPPKSRLHRLQTRTTGQTTHRRCGAPKAVLN